MKCFVAGAMMLGLLTIGFAPALALGPHFSTSPDQVRRVQQTLNDMGYDAGAVDGVLGPHTASALRQFQQAGDLDPTGGIDAKTLIALNRAPASDATPDARRRTQGPVETPEQERKRLIPESEPY